MFAKFAQYRVNVNKKNMLLGKKNQPSPSPPNALGLGVFSGPVWSTEANRAVAVEHKTGLRYHETPEKGESLEKGQAGV